MAIDQVANLATNIFFAREPLDGEAGAGLAEVEKAGAGLAGEVLGGGVAMVMDLAKDKDSMAWVCLDCTLGQMEVYMRRMAKAHC